MKVRNEQRKSIEFIKCSPLFKYYKFIDIELLLTAVGAIDKSRVPGAATYDNINSGRNNRDSEDEDEGFGGNRRKTKSTIRSQEEDDADLDWDL